MLGGIHRTFPRKTAVPSYDLQGGPKKRTPILFLGCPLSWTTLYADIREISVPGRTIRLGLCRVFDLLE